MKQEYCWLSTTPGSHSPEPSVPLNSLISTPSKLLCRWLYSFWTNNHMISKHLYLDRVPPRSLGSLGYWEPAAIESQSGCCHVGIVFTCKKLKFLWSFAHSITCWMPLTTAELTTAFTVTNVGFSLSILDGFHLSEKPPDESYRLAQPYSPQ